MPAVTLSKITVEPHSTAKGTLMLLCAVELVDGELISLDIGCSHRYHLMAQNGQLHACSIEESLADKFPSWPRFEPEVP